MVQVVDLTINGNLQKGANINIKITGESLPGKIELIGNLPPNPELANQSKEYWEKYRNLGAPYRIKKGNKSGVIDHNPQKIQNCNESGKDFAENFNIWMKSPEFEPINNKLRTYLNVSEEIRILVRTEDDDLRKLPWDEWKILKEFRYHTIGFSYLESVPQIPNINNNDKNKVRILAILGHNEGIDIIQDQKFLADLPNAEVVFVVKPEKRYINDQLWQQHWDIIFFAGHSETENDIGRIYINSKTDINENSLTTEELWYGLRKAVENGLQLAIFNSCDGLGLSKKINDFLIPQMIIMRDLVPDQVAHEFLKYFLREYSQGKSLYLAVKEAKEGLKILENKFPCANWLPVIFQHPQITPPMWEDLRSKSYGEYINEYFALFFRYKYNFAGGILLLLSVISVYFMKPKVSEYYNYQAIEAIKIQNYESAINQLELVLTIEPKNSQALNNLAYVYIQLGRYQKAIEYASKSIDRGNIVGCNIENFASIKLKNDKNIEAKLNQCKHLMENANSNIGRFYVLKNLALFFKEKGEYQKVEELSKKVIALEPTEGIGYCLLADSLEQQGMKTEKILQNWKNCTDMVDTRNQEEKELKEKADIRMN